MSRPPSPKLERPRSLSIQPSIEEDEKNNANGSENDKGEVPEEPDEKPTENIAKVDVEVKSDDRGTSVKITEHLPESHVGRKTPSHLTEQGFFDLKFYHNKLW